MRVDGQSQIVSEIVERKQHRNHAFGRRNHHFQQIRVGLQPRSRFLDPGAHLLGVVSARHVQHVRAKRFDVALRQERSVFEAWREHPHQRFGVVGRAYAFLAVTLGGWRDAHHVVEHAFIFVQRRPDVLRYRRGVALDFRLRRRLDVVAARLVEARQRQLVDAGAADKFGRRLLLLAQHLVDADDARIDRLLQHHQPRDLAHSPEIPRHGIRAERVERMHAFQVRRRHFQFGIVGQSVLDRVATHQENVVADGREGRPVLALVIPHPQFVEVQQRVLDLGRQVRLGLRHPVNDAARLRDATPCGLKRIETADHDVHRRAARVGQSAGRVFHIFLGFLRQFGFVGAAGDQPKKLVLRDARRVRERLHVGVQLRVVFAHHAELFRRHQRRAELAALVEHLDDADPLHQTRRNSLRDHRIGVALAAVLADACSRRAAFGFVDDIRNIRIADMKTQRHRRVKQRLQIVDGGERLVIHCRVRRVGTP